MIELLFICQRIQHGSRIVETQRVAGFGEARDIIGGGRYAGLGLFDQQRPECQADRDRTDRDDDDD
jgi:hypothetical protein